MGSSPHEFILNHRERDRAKFSEFKHRTFTYTDTLGFLHFLQRIYREHESLEVLFTNSIPTGLDHLRSLMSDDELIPRRTLKHLSSPAQNSACKRLNMFLRWMVRSDQEGVDFGLWKSISSSALYIPLDVHVGNTARRLDLLDRKQNDWKAVLELTEKLRILDANDPVRYDYALFGSGVNKIIDFWRE